MVEEFKARSCWNCHGKLTFRDFCNTNRNFNKERAILLWQSSILEFFCCDCYQSKAYNRYLPIYKKILIIGIGNGGKTAIKNIIIDKNLESARNIQVTRGVDRQVLTINNLKYIIWDMGGATRYRERYIRDNEKYFPSSNEIIYMIDIQDIDYFDKSIEYLSEIVQILRLNVIEETLGLNLKFFILFHKFDPKVSSSLEIIENIEYLTRKIQQLNIPFDYEVCNTSIYNFQKNYSESLFYDAQTSGFGNLLVKLFSPA